MSKETSDLVKNILSFRSIVEMYREEKQSEGEKITCVLCGGEREKLFPRWKVSPRRGGWREPGNICYACKDCTGKIPKTFSKMGQFVVWMNREKRARREVRSKLSKLRMMRGGMVVWKDVDEILKRRRGR